MTTFEIARAIVDVLEEKKGEEIVLLDIHEITDFADAFVVVSGSSDRMLESLADAVLERAKQRFGINGRVEGAASSGWLLADLGDVIVHLLSPDQRDYYQIEQLWSKGKILLRLQ